MNPALWSPIADHLWQSTAFAGVAGLLTLLLRKNRARVRLWVWLAASVKFLIPFVALIALGSHIGWRTARETPQSGLSFTLDEVSQPFTAAAVAPPAKTAPPARNPLAAVLLGVWACGFIGISCSWLVRWRRISAAVRAGSPLQLSLQSEVPVRAVSSPTFLEPGVFGILRPTLFLPEGIFDRLTPAQLKSVIAHELCHARCRDNLIASIQMFVETVFWFHPLVWWIGKRMVEERERACDEEVLRMGGDPRVYAEGILRVCQFYLESPVACVAGVTGSDLKKRMERIMRNRVGQTLNGWRKLLLATVGVSVLAVPLVAGMSTLPQTNPQTKPEAATAVSSMTMVGTVSSGGKSFVSDKDRKSWGVTNPDALKGHTGLHVSITAQVDADRDKITVQSVKIVTLRTEIPNDDRIRE